MNMKRKNTFPARLTFIATLALLLSIIKLNAVKAAESTALQTCSNFSVRENDEFW